MKFTIITATFNSEQNIKECLESIISQTHSNVEHIIIDGKSKDKTIEIVKKYSSVSILHSEQTSGIYDALNKGIQMATGDVIGFLHSDDLFISHNILMKIENALLYDYENKKVSGVFGDLVYAKRNNLNKIVRIWKSRPFDKNKIRFGWTPPHPTLFLRKEVYQKHGLFDISFKTAGDYDFMLRVMKDKEINLVHLPEFITKMRTGGVSTGNLKQLILKSKEDIRALRKNGFWFPLLIVGIKIGRKLPQLLKR